VTTKSARLGVDAAADALEGGPGKGGGVRSLEFISGCGRWFTGRGAPRAAVVKGDHSGEQSRKAHRYAVKRTETP